MKECRESAVRRDRIWLRHGHHAGLEDLIILTRLGALCEHVRGRGDDIDAVDLRRARLYALVAKELRRNADIIDRVAGPDLGDDPPIAGERDLVPEPLHHFGRLSDADRRADLGRVAALARRKLHDDDVAVAKLAL